MALTSNMARLVHLDLKGAPPKLSYLEQVIPLLRQWGASGLLVEYEDTFPYWGQLSDVAASHAYSVEEIQQLRDMASANSLDIVPLIQTFGHLEFVLKHTKFMSLREVSKYPTSLCPTNPDSLNMITQAIDQILQLHPGISHLHIGADEVYHIGVCSLCKLRIERDGLTHEQLFFAHLKYIVNHIRRSHKDLVVLAWDDMFRTFSCDTIRESDIASFIEPMVWHYQSSPLPIQIWETYSQCFPSVWIASAYKGATGACTFATDITFHVDNHLMWVGVLEKVRSSFTNISGIALTGWQRYDHYAVLCELLPQSLPSLAVCLLTFHKGTYTTDIIDEVSSQLNFSTQLPVNPFTITTIPDCNFPGSEVYRAMTHFILVDAQYHNFTNSDRVMTWVNTYNMARNHTNPLHVEPILSIATQLLTSLQYLHANVQLSLRQIFPEVSVEEWLQTYLAPKLAHLTKFVSCCQQQISLWTNHNPPPGCQS